LADELCRGSFLTPGSSRLGGNSVGDAYCPRSLCTIDCHPRGYQKDWQ